ncbi:uncharacterized protein BO97DRAFT_168158 [Aspergillus homomorphus CBS 101889]|uniref:Uncharacterized protein n=1 Tax=Aspergillus homomorphus (strain CBS 101889) TaxID=1450537 RepID=A0A395HP56_ASPHC|nr:hypothetical protein BO97DRAFT_168158 [Aspergillus homomorphus CBS 101889]RAL09396.1 hypothetical protein BO97DRAFT_168158 [Aspergillus homomorphus CBS 101889]
MKQLGFSTIDLTEPQTEVAAAPCPLSYRKNLRCAALFLYTTSFSDTMFTAFLIIAISGPWKVISLCRATEQSIEVCGRSHSIARDL